MPRISPTDWKIQTKIFEQFGCIFVRQKGDHLIYHYPNAKRAIVIPKYDEIPSFVISNNMKTVKMTREEYFNILQNL